MLQSISTLEVRERLGDLLNRVTLRHDQFIITRKGKALAAMVPVERLEQFERLSRQHLLDLLERKRPGSLRQAQADALADRAKHRTRPQRIRKARRR